MASNVELAKPHIEPIIDDPSIDPFTQRPRTPNKSRRALISTQKTLVPPKIGCLFSRGHVPPDDRRFCRDRYSYTIEGGLLYGKSPNFQYIGNVWSRHPDPRYDGSRDGAFIPWPRNKAGEKIEKHLKNESIGTMVGLELDRRPPTNVPGKIKMAFGRAAPGYYAPKYPNEETYFNSNVLHNRHSMFSYYSPQRTWDEYNECDLIQKNYLANQIATTEYQDKYLAHLPTIEKKKYFFN